MTGTETNVRLPAEPSRASGGHGRPLQHRVRGSASRGPAGQPVVRPATPAPRATDGASSAAGALLAGTRVDSRDPLAVLVHGKSGALGGGEPGRTGGGGETAWLPRRRRRGRTGLRRTGRKGRIRRRRRRTPPEPSEPGAVLAPMQGTVIEVLVGAGDAIHLGRELLVMEAMKMQHVIAAERTGRVRRLTVREGDTVAEEAPLLVLDEAAIERPAAGAEEDLDLDAIRPDLAEVLERQALTRDDSSSRSGSPAAAHRPAHRPRERRRTWWIPAPSPSYGAPRARRPPPAPLDGRAGPPQPPRTDWWPGWAGSTAISSGTSGRAAW